MFLAAAPDLDLLLPGAHRTVTHSVTAVAVMTIVAISVTGQVTRQSAWRVALALVAAYASHLLLDWMAVDNSAPRGVQLLWPFSTHWYISGWDVFRGTERRHILTIASFRYNALAIGQEILILAPILIAVRTLRSLKSKVSSRTSRLEGL